MPESEIRAWVRGHLAKLLGVPAESIRLEKELGSYGLDSVDVVLMAAELEEAFGLEIDPAGFLQYATIEAMVASLEQRPGTVGRL
jgi:acyl carrier protein